MSDRDRRQTPSLGPPALDLDLEPASDGLLSELQLAARGVAGPGGSLPHLARISAAFGPEHDLSGISAHVGGEAAAAGDELGAAAYAVGNHVAFGEQPDLHTAAHEAAHVVQQAQGVHFYGGEGDAYERHADAVADRVVAGKSAADLLHGAGVGGSPAGAVVQRKPKAPSAATFKERYAQANKANTSSSHAASASILLAARRVENVHGQLVRIDQQIHSTTYDEKGADGWLSDAQEAVDGLTHVAEDLDSIRALVDEESHEFWDLKHPLATLNRRVFILINTVNGFGQKLNGAAAHRVDTANQALHAKLGLPTSGAASIDAQASALPKDEGGALKEAVVSHLDATKQLALYSRMALGHEGAEGMGEALGATMLHLRELVSLLREVPTAKPYKGRIQSLMHDVHSLLTEAGHDDVAAHLPVIEGSTGLSNAYVQLFDFARHH